MSGKYVFVQNLKEVRFLLCQSSDHSAATRSIFLSSVITIHSTDCDRSFLTRAYPTMKKNNPHTPIMIREALGVEPRVLARYGMQMLMGYSLRIHIDIYLLEFGKEKQELLSGI